MREGMWVRYRGERTGIVMSVGEQCLVDFVDRNGRTEIRGVPVPARDLRQARYDEVPMPRRQFARGMLGYF